jgi:hypothetical protein
MPPLQKKKNNRQISSLDFFISAYSMVLPEDHTSQQDVEKNSVNFHVEIVKKVDKLLQEHGQKAKFEDTTLQQGISRIHEDHAIEMRPPLQKKVTPSQVALEKKTYDLFSKVTIPKEFQTEIYDRGYPNFRFVTSLPFSDEILTIRQKKNKRVQIIDISDFCTNGSLHKKSIQQNNNTSEEKEHTAKTATIKPLKTNNKNEDETQTSESSSTYNEVFLSASKQSEDIEEKKSRVFYLNTSSYTQENKPKKENKKESYLPMDFEEKVQAIKEQEEEKKRKQREHELKEQKRQELEEQKRKKQQELIRRKEEKRLKKLEAKKARLLEKKKKKEAKAALLEEKRKEAENLKQMKAEQEKQQQQNLEELLKEKEQKKQEKRKEKQAKLEEKKHKKEEKETLVKQLQKEKEEKKHKKDKKPGLFQKQQEPQPTLLDDDVRKVLLITDDLLGNLPDKVIDEFAQSKEFELYEKVLSRYKNK